MQHRKGYVYSEVLVAVAFLIYGLLLLHTAWLCDDSYISFRTVENVLRGHGAVWNPGERVQSYSHPLWFMGVLGLRAIVGEIYPAVMGLSLVVSLAAMVLLAWKASSSWPRRAFLILIASASVSFVDFSTSGLENPLTHLLAAIFFFTYLKTHRASSRSLFFLGFIAGLAVLNRQDTGLTYFFPVLLVAVSHWRGSETPETGGQDSIPMRVFRPVCILAFSVTPLLAWMAFSLVYYGFPFPNTAYAKLATGIPRLDMLAQGVTYVIELTRHDPLTIGVILIGIVAGLLERSFRFRMMALSIILQVAYVLWVGGDFMSGRFFSFPFFVSLILIAEAPLDRIPWLKRLGAVAMSLLVLAGIILAPERSPILNVINKPQPWQGIYPIDPWRGIIHERNYYYPWTGLLRENPGQISPETHRWSRMGEQYGEDGPSLLVLEVIGLIGWNVGDRAYIVDPYGLSDPLLARLPCIQNPRWRIGHFLRRIPPGYVRSLIFGDNRIVDTELASFYEDLNRVTRGALFTGERWSAIWRLNTRRVPDLADGKMFTAPEEEYQKPARRHYRADEFYPGEDKVRTFESGVPFALHFPEPRHGAIIEIDPPLNADCGLNISRNGIDSELFMLQGRPAGEVFSGKENEAGLYPIPDEIARQGYDELNFLPSNTRGEQRFRSIRVFENVNPQR